jgi:shikimate kinase
MDLEQLKREEFDAHCAKGTLRLAFIGMSNAGKSYRSKILKKEKDFLWYHVDEEIQKALGLVDMKEISKWLGYPTAPTYPEREEKYLELENHFTAQAGMQTHGQNLVFDTTGSVAHLREETLKVLRENCLMVHLDVGEDSLLHMIEKFFKEPKPVAWCGYFSQQEGESEEAALRRCYPTLLSERLRHYRELAHLTIPASEVYNKTGEETLSIICSRLA